MKVRHHYFLTRCDHCGWEGSSEECGEINYGDDADVTCPKCLRIFIADEIDQLTVNVGDELHQVLADALSAKPL